MLRSIALIYVTGSFEVVPNNEEYREELQRNPHFLLMNWVVGLPAVTLISIIGMKARQPCSPKRCIFNCALLVASCALYLWLYL